MVKREMMLAGQLQKGHVRKAWMSSLNVTLYGKLLCISHAFTFCIQKDFLSTILDIKQVTNPKDKVVLCCTPDLFAALRY